MRVGTCMEQLPAEACSATERSSRCAPNGAETVLHSFNADGTDGTYPFGSSVVLDAAGNLYGATSGQRLQLRHGVQD